MTFLETGLQMLSAALTDLTEKAMVSRWQKEANNLLLRRQRLEKVLTALNDGYDTTDEISAETELSRSTVMRILDDLVNKNRVKCHELKARGRGKYRFELLPLVNVQLS